jgi:hypothetical protein
MSELSRGWANGEQLLLMLQDEARFGLISESKRCWCPKPDRPICPTMVTQEYTYVYGAVNINSGQFNSLILPVCDTACMQIFLDTISFRYQGEKIVMVLDGAGWHKSKSLKIPGNMYLLHLPPYSPELNPVENIWEELREKGFHNRVFPDIDVLEEHLLCELQRLEMNVEITRSISSWHWIMENWT